MKRNEDTENKFERVMMIDDNLIDLYITSRLISKNNFGREVLQYSAAGEALAYLQENQDNIQKLPEVILVDIYMPLMSGFEFMQEFNKLPAAVKNYCNVFIISSSLDQDDIYRTNNDKNIIAFQEKPVTKEFLSSVSKN